MKLDGPEIGILAAIVLMVSAMAFIIGDKAMGEWQNYQNGVVIARYHEGERTTYGTGTAIGSNGQVQVITTTSHAEAKWIVVVRVDGATVSAKASPATWAECTEGRKVYAQWLKGRWTGSNHGWRIASAN